MSPMEICRQEGGKERGHKLKGLRYGNCFLHSYWAWFNFSLIPISPYTSIAESHCSAVKPKGILGCKSTTSTEVISVSSMMVPPIIWAWLLLIASILLWPHIQHFGYPNNMYVMPLESPTIKPISSLWSISSIKSRCKIEISSLSLFFYNIKNPNIKR